MTGKGCGRVILREEGAAGPALVEGIYCGFEPDRDGFKLGFYDPAAEPSILDTGGHAVGQANQVSNAVRVDDVEIQRTVFNEAKATGDGVQEVPACDTVRILATATATPIPSWTVSDGRTIELSFRADPSTQSASSGQTVVYTLRIENPTGSPIHNVVLEDQVPVNTVLVGAVGGRTSTFYLEDVLGSTVGITNSAGGLVSEQNYEAFGSVRETTFGKRYGFTEKENDSIAALTYFAARWLDPRLGRFISQDPLGFFRSPNAYSYIENNPLSYVDPYGLFAWPYTPVGWTGVIAFSAGAAGVAAGIAGAPVVAGVGAVLLVADVVFGGLEGQEFAGEAGKAIIEKHAKKFKDAGVDPKEMQKDGFLPSNQDLKDKFGFTDKEIKDMGL